MPETAATLVAQAKLKEAALNRLYQTIKARLGTPFEQPNDIEAVAEIAHRLISLAQAAAYPLPPPPPRMKFKNSLLSFIRHAASLAGGVLIANPDPRYQALGAVLGAIGAGWGIKDEHAAENPGMKPPSGNGHVGLLILAFLGAAVCSTFTGCASGPGGQASPAQLEARAYALVNTGAVIVASDNPELIAEIGRIAAGVDAVFEKGTLTPEQLSTFLAALKVPEEKRLLLAIGLNNAYRLYTSETGKPLVDVTDPTAAAILKGVKRGITDAIAFSQAFTVHTPNAK